MPIPLLAAGLIAGGSALSGVYSVGKAFENRRYWSEYHRNTGYSPRYPWRAGHYDIVGAMGSTMKSVGMSYGAFNSYFSSGYHPSKMSSDLWYIYM